VATELAERGIDRLAALVVTHPDADHAGGAPDVLASAAVAHLGYVRAGRTLLGAAAAADARVDRLVAGSTVRSGSLRLRVLWPPRSLGAAPGPVDDPNRLSLVALARCHGFRMLLTGDAEAELAPVRPGDIDVLKIAHHGSEDAGLAALIEEADPELAVVSVGEDNPYGHPAPATIATLEEAGVAIARTDLDGEVRIAVGERGWAVDGS
jgi:competence protein ComEC